MNKLGEFIAEKRKQLGLSIRQLALKMGKAPSYISDVEKGYRRTNRKEFLEDLASALQLTEAEKIKMFDCAADADDKQLPQDVSEYVKQNMFARAALRKAKECNATMQEWNSFISSLERRNDKKNS
ncbi:MAG: helix-turn-helix transcriptional regulator [Elusimicrobiales bacterium]|nr:helix-turn-helix transcriptional regulator [Elusimicrobiales bacterium]